MVSLGMSLASCGNENNAAPTNGNNKSGINTANISLSAEKQADNAGLSEPEDDFSAVFAGITSMGNHKVYFFKKFSGIRTITKADKNASIFYKSSIESGELCIVILDSDYNVLRILEANTEDTIVLDFDNSNQYIIRVVGKDAVNGRVNIEIK